MPRTKTPRTSHSRAEAKLKAENAVKCVSDFERNSKLDNLPRLTDTFWRTDTLLPGCQLNGYKMLHSAKYNKGLAFTLDERRVLSIHGLLPVAVHTIDMQVSCCQRIIDSLNTQKQKYAYLVNLASYNRRLFYRLLLSNIELYMPMMDAASSARILSFQRMLHSYGRGLYINIKDLGHVHEVMGNWPTKNVRCVVVSNGASVQSLGDMGVDEMPVLVATIHQNVVYGGIHPDFCLSIMLDVGTNNEDLLRDEYYTGLKEYRPPGELYDKFFEEFTLAVLRHFGSHALILCKDFEAANAKKQLEMYRDRQCIVDVDYQCVAACALSGVIACNNAVKRVLFSTNMILFYGANPTNIGMARLCIAYLKREGLNEVKAKERIWFCDADGLIVNDRPGIPEELLQFANPHEPISTLVEAILELKPNVLVGGCSQANAFTPDVLRAMEKSAREPIIFALSRPVEQAECTAEAAFAYTKGRCVFVSGSVLPPIKYANKMYQPGHCTSNILLPGIAMGVMLAGFTTVPDETFCVAAERLANMVWPNDLAMRNVFPPMRKIQCISLHMAEAVFTYAFRRGLATLWPRPDNPMEYIKQMMYNSDYRMHTGAIYCMEERKIATTESGNYYKLNI